jgi:hypothetical protein
MILSDISLLRLVNQHILSSRLAAPHDVVKSMGAMQAQDYPMSKWAVGLRLPFSTDQDVEDCISSAEILRTHVLRPTWHFVASEDIYWMLDLTAPQVKSAQSYREKLLELSEAVFCKSNRIIEQTLSDGRHCTRDELIHTLNQAGIPTNENRASHLFARAELDKLICSGATQNNKTTYALLSQRVPKARLLSRDESLAELARRYFTSRAPATLQDFTWWSGLPARDTSLALELVKSDLLPETIEGRTYWLSPSFELLQSAEDSALLLPTYDEFIISYTDRSASISPHLEQHLKQISDRGVFWPILVINGQVAGTWKRTIKKDLLTLLVQPFDRLDPSEVDLINQAASRYAHFSGKQLELNIQT